MSVDELPDPPPAPRIERRVVGYAAQWIGIVALAALPVLALLGVLGERNAVETVPVPGGELRLEYPARVGHRSPKEITVALRAHAAPLAATHIEFDSGYLSEFAVLNAWPSLDALDRVALPPLQPGESARVVLEVRPNGFGRVAGELRLRLDGVVVARTELNTFIFP